MAAQSARHDRPGHRVCGHGLAARQLVDGEPDVRRPGLDDWGVDLGLRVAGASPLRTGRLKAYAAEKKLPVRIWVCRPNLTENWLVSLIGGRTVASMPGNSAKCQQSMKKAPLDRTKRQIKAVLKHQMGAAYREDDVVVLIGTRRDESAVRERNMEARGESAIAPVNTAKAGEKPAWVLSPIADFTTLDIFTFLGKVTSGLLTTYSDFQALTEVYRDSAGDCMVNVFIRDGGAERKTGCGARHVIVETKMYGQTV